MTVESRVESGVYWLVIRRPEKLNSLDSETLRLLRLGLREACRVEEASVVAVTGEGRFFSAGVDLAEIAAAKTPAEAARPFMHLQLLIGEVLDCGKPVYAVLNGPAVAGGAEIALAADHSVAVENAWLQWPELRWGLLPPMLLALAQHRGDARLLHLAYTMERVPAREALGLGLVSTIAPGVEDARRLVEEAAGTLSKAPRAAVRSLLEAGRTWKREGHSLARRLTELAQSHDLIEKARAFIEKKG